MTKSKNSNGTSLFIFIGIIFVLIVVTFVAFSGKGTSYPPPEYKGKLQEDLSYSFGFPTHGYYNYGGGPLRGVWPGWWRYYRPYYRRRWWW